MVTHLLSPWFVSTVLRACGTKVSYRHNLALHLSYLPARYIPGGVWHTVARVSGLHRFGVRPSHLSCFVIIENLVAVCVTLAVGGSLIGFYKHNQELQLVIFCIATASLILLILCPALVNKFVLRADVSKINFACYIKCIFIVILFWMVASASFTLFIYSFLYNSISSSWIEIIGVYLFSWGVGFVAIFAPQGVGVFEVVAATVMQINLPFSTTLGILSVFRFVAIFADFCAWVVWSVWKIFTNLSRMRSVKENKYF
jgi:hypothetical protein